MNKPRTQDIIVKGVEEHCIHYLSQQIQFRLDLMLQVARYRLVLPHHRVTVKCFQPVNNDTKTQFRKFVNLLFNQLLEISK